MNKELADERIKRISDAYNNAQVRQDVCTGCGRCVDVCWHDGIGIEQGKAKKKSSCIGCGYCFQVCPAKALNVDSGTILASVFKDNGV
jgi:ferredoxin